MELRVEWENKSAFAQRAKQASDGIEGDVRAAMLEAAEEIAEFILFRGAEDITEAGNFGDAWVDALRADVTETQRTVRVEAGYFPGGDPVTYWRIFQHGGTIFANNDRGLLTWPNTGGFSIDGKIPAFISKAEVTIPKKFNIIEIIEEEASRAREVFARIMSER